MPKDIRDKYVQILQKMQRRPIQRMQKQEKKEKWPIEKQI